MLIGFAGLALAQQPAQRTSLVGDRLLMVDEVGSRRESLLAGRALVGAHGAWSETGALGGSLALSSAIDRVRFGVAAAPETLDFDGRLIVLERSTSPFGLGIGGRLTLPTVAEEQQAFELSAAFDRRVGRALLAVNAGTDGDHWLSRAGATVVVTRHTDAALEASLQAPGALVGRVLASAGVNLGPDWRLHAGAGTVLEQSQPAGFQLLVGLGYRAPLTWSRTDTDGDGLANREDRCSDTPEDVDGWSDSDGCPEFYGPESDGYADTHVDTRVDTHVDTHASGRPNQ